MKKFTLLAAAALAALSASAQFNSDKATVAQVMDGYNIFDAIILNDGAIDELKAAGKTVNDYRVNEENRFLYLWDGLTGADGSYPGAGMHLEGYMALQVTGAAGWSGGGYFEFETANVDLSHLTSASRFHLCYRTESVAPASVALLFGNSADTSTEAKVAIGANFDDNGNIYPKVADALTEEWQTLDISLGELAQMYPSFDVTKFAVANYGALGSPNADGVKGANLLSFLAGNIAGSTFCFDQVYFYTPETTGVESMEYNENMPCEYYNLQGMRVANPENGLFIRVQGDKAQKVVL